MKSWVTKLKRVLSFPKVLVLKGVNLLPRPKEITLTGEVVVQPPRTASPYIAILVLILVIISMEVTSFDFSILIRNFGNIFEVIAKLLQPNFDYVSVVIDPLFETVRMSFLGSLFGAILSLPVAFIASTNIVKNAYIVTTVKTILAVLRTLPIIIYAVMLVLVFGLGAFAGTLAITLFTLSIVSKMLYEHIETIDMGAFSALEAMGVSKPRAFISAVLPEILPAYYSLSLYGFEINIRHAAILGYVGAGGIGFILNQSLKMNRFQDVSIILMGIFIVVLIIEFTSKYVRKKLV